MKNHRLALLVVVVACGGRENTPPPDRAADVNTTAAAPPPLSPLPAQDSGFTGTTAVTHRPRAGVPQRSLRAVETTTQPGYDRIVFEFAGDSVPGYHLEYATRTVRCGSGDPVAVRGAGRLLVRFEPARAHTDEGRPTLPARERTLGLPVLTEWKLICDFEGQVELLLGVTARAPYRMSEQAAPARLILDVQHAP